VLIGIFTCEDGELDDGNVGLGVDELERDENAMIPAYTQLNRYFDPATIARKGSTK
jgi:hypothetical protein